MESLHHPVNCCIYYGAAIGQQRSLVVRLRMASTYDQLNLIGEPRLPAAVFGTRISLVPYCSSIGGGAIAAARKSIRCLTR